MLEEIQPGGIVIAARLGVLIQEPTDAMENLPAFLARKVRIVLVEDDLEISKESLKFLGAIQRHWYMYPSQVTPKPIGAGMTPHLPTHERSEEELKYLKFFYHSCVINNREHEQVLREARRKQIRHPRTQQIVNSINLVRNAIDAYHNILLVVQFGEDRPAWLRKAIAMGYELGEAMA